VVPSLPEDAPISDQNAGPGHKRDIVEVINRLEQVVATRVGVLQHTEQLELEPDDVLMLT